MMPGYHRNRRYLQIGTGPNTEYQRLSQAASREKLRNAAHAAYGGKCACCGEANPAFLTIDHIHQDGHRTRSRNAGALDLYRQLARRGYPDGFQVLRFNCNCARTMRGGGTCPHSAKFDSNAAQKTFAAYKQANEMSPRKVTAETIVAVHELLADGFSGREVAAALDLNQSTVSRIKTDSYEHSKRKKGGQ